MVSDVDSDFNEEAHIKLLDTINSLGKSARKKPLLKKCKKRVEVQELVDLIRSTRNVDDVKKKIAERKKKKKKKKGKDVDKGEPKTLQAPTYRLARERIESSIAYSDIRKDLEEWAPVVKKNRLAEQLAFPLDKDPPVERTASDRVLSFKPRTPLEIEIAELLSTSKNNLHDGEKYTEAELELLRAMSLKEAKAKWAQLRKMRALVDYREAKLKRQAKIKSKSYHRHLKRQKRKKLVKEFEEMMMKNPDAAKEKLEEIDRQRILERATLKHRNGGKRIQQLAKYASKNKGFKKIFEEQIRLGRELVEKHGRQKDSDSSSESETTAAANMSTVEMLQKAAEIMHKEEHERWSSKPELRAKLYEMRERKQETLRNSASQARNAVDVTFISNRGHELDTEATICSKVCDEKSLEVEWGTKVALRNESSREQQQQNILQNSETISDKEVAEVESGKNLKKLKKKQGRRKLNKDNGNTDVKKVDIDRLFDRAEKELTEITLEECKLLEVNDGGKACDRKFPLFVPVRVSGQEEKKVTVARTERVSANMDISLDPRHFLHVETAALPQVSSVFVDGLEDSAGQVEDQEAVIAKAFEDVDVIGDFEAEKEAVEAAESQKNLDLTLQGWGSWTGPGLVDNKKDRFVIKAREKQRKDGSKTGVIISEAADESIERIQLKSVPFPYTTVEDYEAVVRQPLGKEWNPQRIHRKLIQPQIITKAGRIIKPLSRSVLQNGSVEEKSDSELF